VSQDATGAINPLRNMPEKKEPQDEVHHLEGVTIDDYKTFLPEPSRPPSRGGNTSALHSHAVFIGDRKFTFLARGAKKWIFKTDTASFSYRRTPEGYLNILKKTVRTVDMTGAEVVRGDCGWKAKLRTSPGRMPGSRRERNS
jgi:hypothetical protein